MIVIKKVKTKQEHVWDLTVNGTVIGKATAIYKTPTQRTWNGNINIPLVAGGSVESSREGLRSVKVLVDEFAAEVGDQAVAVEAPAPVVKQAKSKFPAKLTRSAINPGNALELSEHYGYSIVKADSSQRTGAEQAKYLRGLLDQKSAKVAATPMSDLVDGVKQDIQASSLADHYPDA